MSGYISKRSLEWNIALGYNQSYAYMEVKIKFTEAPLGTT